MLYRLFLAACYHLFLALPLRLAGTRFGLWLIPYAGDHAFEGSGIDWKDGVGEDPDAPF